MKELTRRQIHAVYFLLVVFIVFAGSASARHVHKEKEVAADSTSATHVKKEKEAPFDSTSARYVKKEKQALTVLIPPIPAKVPTESTPTRHTKKEKKAPNEYPPARQTKKEKEAPTESTPARHTTKEKEAPTECTPASNAKKEEKAPEKHKTKHTKCGCEESRKRRRNQTCIAKDILNAMNASADPCEDFYQYACGTWMKKNYIPESKTSWSQFRVLYQRNELVMKNLIWDNEDARKKYKDNEAVTKGFDMFDSCMDEDKIESLGAQPLLDLIKDYGSWNITDGNWTDEKWTFVETFVKIHKYLSIAPLFNMYVSADLKDSTKNVIVLDQSGIAISQEGFLKNTSYHAKVRKAYKKLMVDVAKLLVDRPDTETLMMEIYDFEESLAKTFIPREQRRDTNKIYKKMRLDQFIKFTGLEAGSSNIDLMDFLKRMFNETGYKITGDEMVVTFALDYFKNMSLIFKSASKRVIANYMMWHVVLRFSSHLNFKFREVFKNYRQAISGTTAEDPRWQDCLSVVDSSFGMAFGLLFVDETFEGESKKSAEEMIHDIRRVFLANLEKVEWMDEKTKQRAKDKAEAIRENIGYPEYLTNKTALAKMFKGFDVKKDQYFKNILQSYTYFNLKNYAKLGKPVDKERWSMTPPTVNAYYSSIDNKIAFPAGILQKPFYDHRYPKALNYGGIGMVVGHEITHGFDDNGRLFNKDGNLKKWWSNSSISAFKNKTQCLVDQYSKYVFHTKNIFLNGKQTLGENIADNGGIKQAFQAYQNWKKRRGPEPPLPGMEDFTNEQIFFLGFAQIWCSKYRPETAMRQVDFGVHSPGMYRVIGPLSNFDEFAKAYRCPKGSPMNPEKKCAVW
ncbi:endothelin-converting enzyme homolog [Orbicella faveolata]|uniref:endothelin-converting enzyme homolog n=1 Tax=Orbicella faveolata TaxID=48498 RepID=UPI0009E4C026|nr:endothelin-converting enzyme homolog [Orbicella faveolata]